MKNAHNAAWAGFGSMDLSCALTGDRILAVEHVEANAVFTASAGDISSGGVWVVLDFMDFDLQIINTIKYAVIQLTGLDFDQIHILTTHNHGAGDPVNIEAISELAAQAALQAIKNAEPVLVRGIQMPLPYCYNYRRRIYVPEFHSMWTTFGGPDMQEKRSSAGFIEAAINNIRTGKLSYFGWQPSERQALKYAPGDPDFFLMQFKSIKSGNIIGTLSRFAMHAVMRNKIEHFSSDYPWHIRQEAKRISGGHAVFMNGPCGEIAPCFPWPNKESKIEKVYAEEMISKVYAELEQLPFEPLFTAHARCEVPLPVRSEVLTGTVHVPEEFPQQSSLSEQKKFLELRRFSETLDFLIGKYRNGETALDDHVRIELGIMKLGDFTIIAYPGETFNQTAGQISGIFCNAKLVSVTEHGRTIMYIPPAAEYLAGGYEPQCALTSPEAESLLREAAEDFIRQHLEKQ